MSKYTIIGDPHAKPDNLDKIEKLFNIVESHNNSTIWLGDFLDTKEVIRGKCLNFLYKKLKESKLQHYIIVGNHDYFNLECEDHSLALLKELDNVVIVDEPVFIEDNKISMIPYIHDMAKLKATIKKCYSNSTLFAHLELKGFDFGNGHMCDSGLTERSFATFRRTISGHFHKYQIKRNLMYLGTPFSHSFGESNQIKYIGIYDLESDSLDLIETDFPRHVTLEVNCDIFTSEQGYEESNDYIRVILNGTQENIDRFDRSSYPETTKFIERPTDNELIKATIDETLDNTVKFQQWATEIKGLDPETIKLGTEILGVVND
jgi:DNA repair exonuclease SbcCD nuclease subunit